ncbi:MAG: hypothetical protein KAX49_04165 [Halanaerobiales bacterium]|nr:hypothetical protein [Halanaerobiales bacterium]
MRRFFVSFIFITLTIVFISGFYVWLSNKNQVPVLTYVPDPEWSEEHVISPYITSHKFDSLVDEKGNLHTIRVEHDPKTGTAYLLHSVTDYAGKIISEPKTIISYKWIPAISLTINDNKLHIFCIGQGDLNTKELVYINLDLTGEILDQNIVLTGEFNSVEDLITVQSKDGEFMLVWIDMINNKYQLKTLVVNLVGKAVEQPVQVTSSNYNSRRPNLILDEKGRYHLTWREEKPNSYTFSYQLLTNGGEPVSSPRVIDEIDLGAVSMATKGDSLYLVWSKIMPLATAPDRTSILEYAFPNYELFGAVLDLENPLEPIHIQRLTEKNGPSSDQTIVVDSKGQLNLVYVDGYHNKLALTHQIYIDDFNNLTKATRRLYPDQITGSKTKLIKDPNKGLHLVWLESDTYGGNIYYANTVQPKKVSILQVIGINATSFSSSFIMSMFYIFSMPIFSILFFLQMVSIILLTLGIMGITKISHKTKLGYFLTNPYVAISLICLIHCSIYLVIGKMIWILWPVVSAPNQLWFIFILASIAIFAFIKINELRKITFTETATVAFIWIYWLNMINLFFNIPFINF